MELLLDGLITVSGLDGMPVPIDFALRRALWPGDRTVPFPKLRAASPVVRLTEYRFALPPPLEHVTELEGVGVNVVKKTIWLKMFAVENTFSLLFKMTYQP